MKRIRKKHVLFTIILVVCLAAVSYVSCIYHGYLLLNNPSRHRYPVVGIDLSHYQGRADWDVLSRQEKQI